MYKNCRELPIHNFYEVTLSGDLKNLVKSNKEYTELELSNKWLDILDEYTRISKDDTILNKERLKQDYDALMVKLITFELIYDGVIDGTEILQMYKLKKSKLKSKINNLKIKIALVETKLNLKEDDTESSTFEQTIVKLSKFFGFKIDRYTTTVSEWCAYIQEAKENGRKDRT